MNGNPRINDDPVKKEQQVLEITTHTKSSGLDVTNHSEVETGNRGKLTFLGIPLLTIITSSFASVFAPVWKSFCAIRWFLASPVNIRFLPKCFPAFKGVPYLKHLAHVTYGEVR